MVLVGGPLVVLVVTNAWQFYDLDDLLFNLASPLTRKLRVYPVVCEGTVLPGNVCCGELGMPLNPTTFTVSPGRQQVLRSTAGASFPLDNCRVQDYLTWECTTYWADTGTYSPHSGKADSWDTSKMSNGTFSAYSRPGSHPLNHRPLELAYVKPLDFWLGLEFGWESSHQGIWNGKDNYVVKSEAPICKDAETNVLRLP